MKRAGFHSDVDRTTFRGAPSGLAFSVPTPTPRPAMNLTPLSPLQLERHLRTLRRLIAAGTVLSPRTLMSNHGLSGLPLEQVLTAYENED